MRRVRTFASALIFLLACSCQASTFGGGVKEEFHESYTLSPGGSVRLGNVNGSVEIKVWDKNEVEVDAVKRADDKESMDELQVIVNASKDLVDIDTKYPEGEGHHGLWVEYMITVPRSANLDRIKTVNGDIEIAGVIGKIEASTVNGIVRVSDVQNDCRLETINGKVQSSFAELKSGASVTLKTVNGTITANLPENSDVRVKAKTVSGHISNDFGFVSSRDSDEHSFVKIGDSVDGKIGNGGAYINAESVNGSIKILKSGEGK